VSSTIRVYTDVCEPFEIAISDEAFAKAVREPAVFAAMLRRAGREAIVQYAKRVDYQVMDLNIGSVTMTYPDSAGDSW
jgi:hypothetical protein